MSVPSAAITIGLPFLDAERTLVDAIRSVFAQSRTDWRLLLVDDGSSDGSLALARAVRDPRVTVVSDGVRRGLVHRLNQIAAAADTPFLARMDADDLMHPRRLERQLARLEEDPALDVLGTAAVTIEGDATPTGRRGTAGGPVTARRVLRRGLLIHPTVAYRTAFARENPYDAAYPRAEDLELWCRIAERARIAWLDEPLLFYREPSPVNLAAYVASARTRARIVAAYGAALGPVERTALQLRIAASVAAYQIAGKLGAQRLLVAARSAPLTLAETEDARRTLAAIRGIEVPGLAPRRASSETVR